jgi:hypothetical protein
MRLLAVTLSALVVTGAGAGAAFAVGPGQPSPDSLTAVQVVDHAPAAWHVRSAAEHR